VNIANSADKPIAILVAGGIPAVLVAMKAYQGHVRVQNQGCLALAHLFDHTHKEILIAASEATCMVLAAMKAHRACRSMAARHWQLSPSPTAIRERLWTRNASAQ